VQGEVCVNLLEVGLGEEIRRCASETLSQAKQIKMAQLETLRQKFLRHQLQKYWKKCVT
jgi:hypothetical protein